MTMARTTGARQESRPMTEEALTREESIRQSIDALGKQWVIHRSRGHGLCYARPIPDRADAQIPVIMKGRWTKAILLQEQINNYVTKTWDIAAKAQATAERTKLAAKENKAKNDKGSKKH